MFQPTNFTLTNVFLATKEQALQDAHKFLKQVTGFVTVNRIDNTVKTGSAFFFCNSFHLLTAAHVVQDASSISVTFPDHGIFNATVIRSDTRLDLALLHMTELEGQMHSLPYLKLAPECPPGTIAFCAGFYQSRLHCTEGIVTNSDDPHTIVVSNLSDNGTSGGPSTGRLFRNLLGVIREDFGTTHHRTALIPALDVDHFLRADPNGPQMEVFRL
jgi:hypothetical protein